MVIKKPNRSCECLGMIHYASYKSTVSFVEHLKGILIEVSRISYKVGHKKRKRKDNQKYREQKYIVHKIE